MVIDSILLVGRHYYLYFIPLIYLFIATIVFTIIGFVGISFVMGITVSSLVTTGSLPQAITVLFSGYGFVFLLVLILIGGFFTGYIGGLGQMLKGLLTTDRISTSEFINGIFRHGPRLLLGLVFFSIIILLPFIWGIDRLLNMYGIFDFATMESGWNHCLRESIGQAHSGIVFWTYVMQIIIAYILSLWWVISISETRHFISSYIKSVVFVFKNPVGSIVVIPGCVIALTVAAFIFSNLFGAMGLSYELGWLVGLYLVLPLVFIIILQFYDPRYIPAEK
ncbi:hypothetical protein J7L05_03845 [bacterium]|nr:hypothetical protein [bacterium]